MKNEQIEHEGVVTEVDSEFITVEISRSSACGACGAKSLCFGGDSSKGMIQIPQRGFILYEPGEKVRVIIEKSMGFKALWISYMIPLVILIVLLTIMSLLGASELIAGLSVIAGIALYYFIIWLVRDKIKNEFNFRIEKIK
ncbi:MAG: SoxR reducing system RseC family protein [Bacteroidales bacterium]|nr:SoxR reducing system RseC family protein [Bacteroidales bacterium]MDD2425358.1 SoxR reducing system RseC family protein [Bacteroidales bacterium]MDD3989238.1 SoxR reducing system RseC family protein [Bacteroidales bacterium]MDD4638403.1 SoxR reducing system RseC family protein [Bacteroidales bacterium]